MKLDELFDLVKNPSLRGFPSLENIIATDPVESILNNSPDILESAAKKGRRKLPTTIESEAINEGQILDIPNVEMSPVWESGGYSTFDEMPSQFNLRGNPNYNYQIPGLDTLKTAPTPFKANHEGIISSAPSSTYDWPDDIVDNSKKAAKGKGWSFSDFGKTLKNNKGKIAGLGLLGGLIAWGLNADNENAEDQFRIGSQPNLSQTKQGSNKARLTESQINSSFNPLDMDINSVEDAARLLRMLSQDQFTTGTRDDEFRRISREGKKANHSKDEKQFYQNYINDEFDIIKKLASRKGLNLNNNEVYKKAFGV